MSESQVRRSSRRLSRLDLSGKWLEKIPSDHLKLQNASTYSILKLSCNYRIKLTEEIKNFTNLQELDASECGIQYLPRDLSQLKSIEKLCLFGNTLLKNFPKEILRLESLTELNLEQCGLQEIPKEISQLNKLEKLNLRGNRRLRQVPVELFGLTVLRELNLGECGLTTLPSELSNVKQLEKLQLFGNVNLRSIPNPVFALKLLKELDVGSCSLNQLPEEKRFPAKLQCLHLQGNRELGRVPRAVFSVSDSLKELSLARCGLTNIPENIKQLKKLDKLNISGNKELKTLPQSLYTLKLRELNVCECNLTDLERVEQLKKLRNLYLRGNEKLRQLPRGIMDLVDLVELDVSRCGLIEIDHNFSRLLKLKKLHISDNPHLWNLSMPLELPKNIEELNVSRCGFNEMNISFVRLTKLRTLYVSDCGRMEPQLIEKLPLATLKELDISGCSTTSLQITPDDLEKRCPQLVKLKLGSNTLLTTDLDKIFQLKKVEKLDISVCNLTQLPDVGDAGQRLTSLDAHGNSIGELDLTALRRLEHLRELNLSACQLSQIPTEISELKYLAQLNLSQNLLSTLPNSVKKITQLAILDISENFNIKQLPQVITTLKALKKLDISLCPVLNLPNGFEKLTELEVLSAQNTGLSDYPNVTLKLKSLMQLDLSNRLGVELSKNTIKELPVNLVDAVLEELLLTGNPMAKPPPHIFEQGMRVIRKYLHDIIPGGRLVCAETVNMLGHTGAGKTSIVESLLYRRPCLTSETETRVMKQVSVELLNEHFVNINDFGGHDIYQTVLPMFLPLTGIGILAYNMEESIEEQKEKVRSWVTTLLAKSPGMRLIVVGTHTDLVKNHDDRAKSEQEIKLLVEDLFLKAENELRDHVCKLECEMGDKNAVQAKTEGNGKKLLFLSQVLGTLKEGKRSYVSLSCKEDTDSGLSVLNKVVSQMIKPPDQFPASWYHVMKDVVDPSIAGSSCYIEWKQVEDIFCKHVPQKDSEDTLKIILRYLVATSQVIWLEDHPTLGKQIFHRIDHILGMCKAVLHHKKHVLDSRFGYNHMPEMFEDDADRYSRGHLSGTFLNYLLKSHLSHLGPVCDTMTELLLHFNLISRVNVGETPAQYIVPSRLEERAPEEPCLPGDRQLRPNVLIRMRFYLSTMPLALFETSLASLLTWMHAKRMNPLCWKHGVCFGEDGVMLSYVRNGDTLEVKAAADGPRELWKFLHPVLKTVAEHVLTLWKGALPQCILVCPSCRCCGTHSLDDNFQWSVLLEDFTSTEECAGIISFCKECKQEIRTSARMSSLPVFTSTNFARTSRCHKCNQDIPRSLRLICHPETITDKDCADVSTFTEKLVERCPRYANEKPQSILKKKFQKASKYLLKELDECDAQNIVDTLHADELDDEHYENFQALLTRTQKVRYLINEIIKHQPEKTARVALETLESMPRRKYLAEYIQSRTIP